MRQTFPPPTDRHELLSALAESGLLTVQQFAKADGAVPESTATAGEAARRLVAAKVLTQFQAARLLAGRTDGFVLGQHVIQDQVGKGAFGRVYRATHRAMNRTVAIKVLSAEVTRTTSARQAFQREMKAAARLNHPNIVTAFDTDELGDRSYLVMEFVDGPTVEALVRDRGPLPWPEACELIRQVAVGLQHAHDTGMVHRDIKPANLLVTRPSNTVPGCVVKIADFGIARLSPTSNASAAPTGPGVLGTPDYVAPEQAYNPHTADHRADLYSLGCVFYFLLAGRPPFAGSSIPETVRRHQFEAPLPIERVRPDVHPVVAEIIGRLLAKDPNQRIATAAEVASRLEGLADSGDAVTFDLPAVQVGPYSFASGTITGRHAVHPAPPVGGAETSPWSQLTDEAANTAVDPHLENTPLAPRRKRPNRRLARHRGLSTPVVLTLCAAVALACLIGFSVLLRLAGK